ncbi:HAD family hydrolase [Natronorubrum halophilum]|uniref:HAD family hydrolase n=1 Tax=Natronorubrum halophilum TaxID=1702106 RepID=UPI000EF6F574|nr:HAD family phosphatase [Natronorubrum halophilum]
MTHRTIDAPPGVTVSETSTWKTASRPELVAFDFDGTLVDQRGGWLLLQELFGTRDQGKVLTEQYREGERTFPEWCEENVALLADRSVTEAHICRAAAAVKLTRGAEALLETIASANVPFGTVSAGVTNLQDVLTEFGPEFTFGNEIRFDDSGTITGVDAGVGPDHKDDVLERVCRDRGITTDDVFYIGDSHTDEEAFEVAGTSVLFDPDDRIDDGVYEVVDAVVDTRDLRLVENLFATIIH